MKKFNVIRCTVIIGLGMILLLMGCSGSESNHVAGSDPGPPVTPAVQTTFEARKAESPEFVDVRALANQPPHAFEDVFGKPVKVTIITDDPKLMPGEYRLYNVKGHPKGLSVRFYRDKAKRFNLLLGTPQKSAKNALAVLFRIDVSSLKTVIGAEPLSEKWKGESQGLIYNSAYAKREKLNGDFTMVHAEVR